MNFRGFCLRCALGAVASALAPAAFAADDTGFYIVGEGGIAHLSIDYYGQVNAAYSGSQFVVANANADDTRAGTWAVNAGYQFHPSFGIEFGYADLGDAKTSYTLQRLGTFSHMGTFKVTALHLSPYALLPVTEALGITGKAGVAYTKTKYSESGVSLGQPTSFTADPVTQFRFVAGLGTRYELTRRLALRFEWDNYFGVGRTFSTGSEENGKFDSISTYQLGLEYRF